MKRHMIGVAFLISMLLGSMPAWAIQSPQDMVQQTAEKMLSKLRTERQVIEQHPGRIYELVDEILLPHFDFERMSSWVLGKYWRRATPEQRKEFMEQFKALLIRTYAKSLSSYADDKITYLPFRGTPEMTDVKVRTEVDQPGGFPIPIDYALHLKDGEWKVYDVTIDGVSLVTNYRTTFSNQIRQDGLDKLIASLADRNKQDNAQ